MVLRAIPKTVPKAVSAISTMRRNRNSFIMPGELLATYRLTGRSQYPQVWRSSAKPPLVKLLENHWLHMVETHGVTSSFFASQVTPDLRTAFERKASVSEIADIYLFGLTATYVGLFENRMNAPTAKVVSLESIAADLVFERSKEIRMWLESLLQGIAERSPYASKVIRVHFKEGARHKTNERYLTPLGLLHSREQGDTYSYYSYPAHSILQEALHVAYSPHALEGVMVAGSIHPVILNRLHSLGYRALGMPVSFKYADKALMEPLRFYVHDVGHQLGGAERYTRERVRAVARANDPLVRAFYFYGLKSLQQAEELRGIVDTVNDLALDFFYEDKASTDRRLDFWGEFVSQQIPELRHRYHSPF